mmetsp:Transcript_41873/g.87516  ORF Transcript_41873/g.87516 Transcript_41873/m.87516 type:complete len:104 (-) Transcript_41873:67-378(-)
MKELLAPEWRTRSPQMYGRTYPRPLVPDVSNRFGTHAVPLREFHAMHFEEGGSWLEARRPDEQHLTRVNLSGGLTIQNNSGVHGPKFLYELQGNYCFRAMDRS